MANGTSLSLPASIFEELQCFACKGYLSSGPVLLLPNGKCICGRCSPLNTETQVHQVIPFESLLSKISFPCIFKDYGCSELILFGKTAKHESECVYIPFSCPSNSACLWKGSRIQMFRHFTDSHRDLVKEKIQFSLVIFQNTQGFLTCLQESCPFIAKYFYKAEEKILRYDVRYCSNNQQEVSCRTQVTNGADLECNINLKMQVCSSYDESFGGVENAHILDLSKFLQSLGDPESVIVGVNFKFVNTNFATEVNSNIIDVCRFDLVLPIHDLVDHKSIDGECVKFKSKCIDQNDTKPKNEAMLPCRWGGCVFFGKSNILKNHEMNCEFCLNSCPCCGRRYKFSEAIAHLQTHTYKGSNTAYMPNRITYKVSFDKKHLLKDILTIKNRKIVLFKYGIIQMRKQKQYQYVSEIKKSTDNLDDLTAIIHFKHEHCKLASKQFKFTACKLVSFKHLPPCFKRTDELTVTVELIVIL